MVPNNPVATGTSQITVAFISSGTGTFYSDAAGTNAITSINLAAAASDSAGFYYKATVVGSGTHTLTGASGSLTSATTPFTISAANPVATKLAFSSGGAQSLTVNVVSGAIVVQRQNASNNPVATGTSQITVALIVLVRVLSILMLLVQMRLRRLTLLPLQVILLVSTIRLRLLVLVLIR